MEVRSSPPDTAEHQDPRDRSVSSPYDDVESICSELEHTELTDEDTTSLLNDALELNKRLKAELRRQELEERDGQDEMKRSRKMRNHGNGVSKRGDAMSASLPPINPKRGLSVNQHRIYNTVDTKGNNTRGGEASGAIQRKTQSADGNQRPASSSGNSRPRGIQSAGSKNKPEWNDRFSY